MGLYPVSVTIELLLDNYDGQPKMFWKSFGGGWALVNESACRRQIGDAARVLAASDYFDNAETTYLRAKVDIYQDNFEIDESDIEQFDDHDMKNRPRSLQGKSPSLELNYKNLRTAAYQDYF